MQPWAITDNLNVAREGHTATLLPNGTVLVHGGLDRNRRPEALRSSELFHPTTETWTPTGSAFYERSGHTATLLPNGRVLVAGGGVINSELYDPTTGEWYATGSLQAARFPGSHAATSLADGRVLVVGGYDQTLPPPDQSLSGAEIYDPVTQVWTPTGNLKIGRFGPTATLLSDGKVLVVGGINGSKGYQNTAELYDPATGAWTNTGGLFYYRARHTATRLLDGKVLVTGGFWLSPFPPFAVCLNASEIYDPASGNWYSVGNLNVARRSHTATLLPDGKVLVAGGLGYDNSGFLNPKSTELYDPGTFVWTYAGDLNTTARTDHTETLLRIRPVVSPQQESKVLVAGGENAGNTLNSAELYSTSGPGPVLEP
jgi:hypothetical protein